MFTNASWRRFVCGVLFSCCVLLQAADAHLHGVVRDPAGKAVPGVTVQIGDETILTDVDGVFMWRGEAQNTLIVAFSYFGQPLGEQRVALQGAQQHQDFTLDYNPNLQQVVRVFAERRDVPAGDRLREEDIRLLPAPVTGELLRSLRGVDAVRRGPTGLDPVVQGLRETQVGQYVDGTRIFPAGPARMDSALSHIDPSALQTVQVVKGPYALAWGAGNLSAIRVETFDLDRVRGNSLNGQLLTGYRDNVDSQEFAASAYGRTGVVSYWVHGVDRQTEDYESGDGQVVPADMESREIRGKFRFHFSDNMDLTLDGGFQDQEGIDYPGRLLDAEYFETEQMGLTFRVRDLGAIQNLNVRLYRNNVDHRMNNDEKPTALGNPNRMPPFPLDIFVETESETLGGRLAFDLLGESWSYTFGADFYQSDRLAVRTIQRRDMNMLIGTDRMWPDAEVDDYGVFARATGPLSDGVNFEATVRYDRVQADARQVTDFFLANAGSELDAEENNLSTAVLVDIELNDIWTLSMGLGSTVRTADANERFSDRIPTARAQFSAEFMGNPQLDPERANQADLWLNGSWSNLRFQSGVFFRRIDDYITIQATDLPRRLPLSPSTVYRYVNGEADFFGVDAALTWIATPDWRVQLATAYLEGDDNQTDEPAYGIAPWKTDLSLRYGSFDSFFAEAIMHLVDEQDEVAVSRNEAATDSYITADLTLGYVFGQQFTLQIGAVNLFDEAYTNHLNARNPFTAQPLPEPGRIVRISARYAF